MSHPPDALNVEANSIKDDQIMEEGPASAHTIGTGQFISST